MPARPVFKQLPEESGRFDVFGTEVDSHDGGTPRGAAPVRTAGGYANGATPTKTPAGAEGEMNYPYRPTETEAPKSRIPRGRKRSRYSRRNIAQANAGTNSAVHPHHLAVIGFSIVGMIVAITGMATINWYLTTDGNSIRRIGMWQECDEHDECGEIVFTDLNTTLCTRTAAERRQAHGIVRALLICSCALTLLALLCALLARKVHQAALSIAAIVLTALAALGYILTVALFVRGKESWEYCGRSFCAFIQQDAGGTPNDNCDASYGYSLGLVAIAMGASLIALVFCITRYVFREWNLRDERAAVTQEAPPKNRPRSGSVAAPTKDSRNEDVQLDPVCNPSISPEAIPPPPEEGDWLYDEECGMYWSEQEFLFLDPFTQHSYDPNSDMWYDPDAEEWYQGETKEG